jgi:glycine/D-amino acid oxidase-like deaminating enzyme
VRYRTVVIGGGFYGCCLALARREAHGESVLVLEREPSILARASLRNQARVHRGYHYPRSFLTAARSNANLPRFVAEFRECIVDSFEMIYAIPRRFSNVTAAQFLLFCQRVGAPIAQAAPDVVALFDPHMVEDVFRVDEPAFDATALADLVRARLESAGVDVRTDTEVTGLEDAGGGDLVVHTKSGVVAATVCSRDVIACVYSRLNVLLAASGMPTVPLRHEVTELALVEPPAALEGRGVTVMCGPFFSTMPYPARSLHSFSHVRYTPHSAWEDSSGAPMDPDRALAEHPKQSRAAEMIRDAARYLPAVRDSRYRESLWEVKTILPRNDIDDGRPILARVGYGHPALTCVLGSKIDNIYDVIDVVASRTVAAS